jgi:hypothetical protein
MSSNNRFDREECFMAFPADSPRCAVELSTTLSPCERSFLNLSIRVLHAPFQIPERVSASASSFTDTPNRSPQNAEAKTITM